MTMFRHAAFAAAIAVATAPAFAAAPEAATSAVSYAGLDLATARGASILHHRIAASLEAVCGSYAGTQYSAGDGEVREIARCRANAGAQADRRLAMILAANARTASLR